MKDLGLRVGDTFTGPPGLPQVSRAKALPIRLDADGREVSVPYTIRPIRPLFTNSLALKAGVQTLLLLLAWTLLARGNDGPSTLLLAGLMLADSFPEPFTYPGSQYEFLWAWLIMDVLHVIAVALFITFILQTAQPPLSERARRAWHWITFALVSAGIVTKVVPYLLGMVWYSMPNRIFNLGWIVVVFGVAIGLLMHAIRHQRGDDRRRSRWLLVVAGTLASDLVWNGIGVFDLWSWTIWAVLLSVQIAAWLLLMGIVLVQRIVDLRVVLNRAVVYAMVSGAMLIAFALVELFSHNVLHSEGQGLPVLLQTIVAIAGVLVFRKIHHKLDHWVESVLFKRWHQSIVAFKRFESTRRLSRVRTCCAIGCAQRSGNSPAPKPRCSKRRGMADMSMRKAVASASTTKR